MRLTIGEFSHARIKTSHAMMKPHNKIDREQACFEKFGGVSDIEHSGMPPGVMMLG
jgi:hypothetical protein